jgi:cytochrome P450
MDPPEHSFRRQMVAGEFAVNRIERLRPAILATVARQLDGMQLAGPPADLLEHYARPIPSSVIAAMLGIPDGDDEFFQENTLMITSGGVSVSDGAAATQRLWDYLERLMHTKQAEASDDMLSRFVEFVAQGHITYEEAVNGALELLIGGHETTAHQIALGVLTLLENPHQLAALKQDPANIKPAVEEILRFINVTQAGRRRVATEDIEVGGQVIRAGEALIVAGDSGNHDESVFENPERFDISRDARGHVAFGYGIHQCVGQRLARAEVQIAIAELWRRMPNLRLAVPFDQLEFREGAVVYGLNSLPVEW